MLSLCSFQFIDIPSPLTTHGITSPSEAHRFTSYSPNQGNSCLVILFKNVAVRWSPVPHSAWFRPFFQCHNVLPWATVATRSFMSFRFSQDNEGNSPVHLASTEGFDRVIETLLEYNANPDLPNAFGKTALHYLAMKNHFKAITVSCQQNSTASEAHFVERGKHMASVLCHVEYPLAPDWEQVESSFNRNLRGSRDVVDRGGQLLPEVDEKLCTYWLVWGGGYKCVGLARMQATKIERNRLFVGVYGAQVTIFNQTFEVAFESALLHAVPTTVKYRIHQYV